MSAENLLNRLEKVKRTGKDKWQARCPHHDDKGPSLAVREMDDGRVLIHCFAGCGAAEVLGSVGMDFADLFPPTEASHIGKVRKPWNATDVLHALSLEILIAWNYTKLLANGDTLTDSDRERLLLCASRMQSGLGLING